jgi:ribosomal protein S18 acetylase RimI-like enzyme
MEILKITDSSLKSEACNLILRSLPLWFGIESAVVDYVNDVKSMDTWVAYQGQQAIGFISINKHFAKSAEVHVMGTLQEFHRKGIGQQLLQVAEDDLRAREFKFLTVKTLSESRHDANYDKTRNFYLKAGFTPIEEFKTLWGEHNPCLLMAKAL